MAIFYPCLKNISPFCPQEENDVGDFFLILEKDPQQEDFLQGRMLGNPYSSSEAGLGPLMRDVKNKICQGMYDGLITAELCYVEVVRTRTNTST